MSLLDCTSRELKNLRNLVAEAKAKDVKVVPALVKRMLDRNMFLFGFVDVNKASAAERQEYRMQTRKGSQVGVAVERGTAREPNPEEWKAQKELFYQLTGIRHQPVKYSLNTVREEQEKFSQQEVAEEQDGNEDFSKELEEVLLSEQNHFDFEEKGRTCIN
ncbi:hypothetical protein RND71_006282 [Anisodus tanguticus]|uniref:Uncharacterized protein n=1 Tax=Anisodus tanguticus TaxID=243964 RepID=A0AAE1STN0_9SOLA|nr:hypothetical protein RND71_006282 [Anisodus tanguticus]